MQISLSPCHQDNTVGVRTQRFDLLACLSHHSHTSSRTNLFREVAAHINYKYCTYSRAHRAQHILIITQHPKYRNDHLLKVKSTVLYLFRSFAGL